MLTMSYIDRGVRHLNIMDSRLFFLGLPSLNLKIIDVMTSFKSIFLGTHMSTLTSRSERHIARRFINVVRVLDYYAVQKLIDLAARLTISCYAAVTDRRNHNNSLSAGLAVDTSYTLAYPARLALQQLVAVLAVVDTDLAFLALGQVLVRFEE
jgi:hypothetical protein